MTPTPDPDRPVGGGRAPAAEGPLLVRPARPQVGEPEWAGAARRVVEHTAGPLRVIGGPGTGKTSVLLASVARRIREGVDPGRVLVLVGSRRAASDLRERLVRAVLPAGAGLQRTTREMLVRTVHSYAFGIMRLHAARAGDPPPRLLAGAEQDAVVRDLLAGELANWNGTVPGSGWPDRIRAALGVPAFAGELRELLLRAEERGLGPEELLALGTRHGVPEWEAAGRFFRTYEQVILLRGAVGRAAPQATAPALDSAELVAAALDALAFDPELLAAERERVRHLYVDDAQDLDPQQLELVRVLARTATSTLLAGDPDQAVLGFRGADPEGLRAVEAPTETLTVDHRQRDAVRAAGSRLASRLAGSGEGRLRIAPPEAGDPADPADPGSVLVRTFTSAATEAAWIADRLRRAHLLEGVPWSEMAVLSRSARRTLPALRRALVAAGVPIAAPPEELPLARQPAVLPFLLVLRAATRPESIDADVATALLTSVLGAGDPMRMRRLRRGLLRLHAAAGRRSAEDPWAAPAAPAAAAPAAPTVGAPTAGAPDPSASSGTAAADSPPTPEDAERAGSDPLLVEALRAAAAGRPDPLTALPPGDSAPLRAVSTLLATAAAVAGEGRSVEEVLWQVWDRSGLARKWAGASARGGPVGAAADRDLDAVLALFEAAARYTDRLPGADVAGFAEYLGDQHLPGDTGAVAAPREEAVALLTAHASRGREWEVVAVPGVQEGSWPDLRLRGSLLGNERLVDVVAGVADPADGVSRTAPLLAEERRLFYVACTRAKRTLLVSAVHAEDEQPSRFLDELDPLPADAAEGRTPTRPGRALVLAELVGELRRAVAESDHGDPDRMARRRRAALQLARLAEDGVPGARPEDWYGLAEPSAEDPLRAPGEVVPVSPSDVDRILACPLRWVLERHGGAEIGALSAVTGSLVHALVQAGAAGADPAEIDAALRAAWARLDAGAPWYSRRELARVRGMLAGFDQWLRESRAAGLRLVAVEHPVQLDIEGDDPDQVEVGEPRPTIRLRGRVDRLEVDDAGRAVVVDVKTGRTAVSAASAAEHPQLAVYQLAATLGAFSDLLGEGAQPGGARLVFVADRSAKGSPKEKDQPPLEGEAVGHWLAEVREAAGQTSGPAYVARVGPDCDRCPVRTSCPAVESGRPVVDP
ncbi:ATP-dependent DNA helicase [Pseudonocardia xishanensis]|uniref:DNA 3'-5' helicase n=1 Tax=Pseudonocardia xishanensis TaxID=630995 RepID=A0ABP8S4W7_9PSEU